MIQYTGRTIIGSVVFLDIVEYSIETDARQMAMKRRLNEIIGEAVAGVAEAERIILDTGDGASICFLGDPEDALFVATAVNDAVRKETNEARQVLRIGINLGPIKAITDVNGHPNVVGDGINVAQRIMSFAADDEILVSRSYYEVVARLKEGNEQLFTYLGAKKDKHVREHQVYALSPDAPPVGPGAWSPEALATPSSPAVPPDSGALEGLTQGLLKKLEQRLADRIGPLARVIVSRAAASAKTVNEFYETIASVIHDDADRATFLAVAPMPRNWPSVVPAPIPAPDIVRTVELSESDLAVAEKRLAEHIGPLAGILVRKASNEAVDLNDLYVRLADHLKNAADKERFLAAAMAEK